MQSGPAGVFVPSPTPMGRTDETNLATNRLCPPGCQPNRFRGEGAGGTDYGLPRSRNWDSVQGLLVVDSVTALQYRGGFRAVERL